MIKKYTLIPLLSGFLSILLINAVHAYDFPPYHGLSLKIQGNIAESYSNNITYATDREDRVEDFLTVLSAELGMNYERKRQALDLSGYLSRQIRTNTGDEENSSERAALRYRSELSKYDILTLSNTFRHTQVPGTLNEGLSAEQCQRLEDLFGRSLLVELYPECENFEDEFGRSSGRLDSYENTATVNYRRYFSERFSINTDYAYRKFWSPEEGTNDSDRHNARIGVNYGYSAATIFSLSYSYSESSYDRGEDISSQSVAAGIRQYITERLYFNGRIGMTSSSASTDNTDIEASLTGQIDEKTNARISYIKEEDISSDREDVFRSWRVTGRFTRQLSEDLSSSLSGFYGEGEFVSQDVRDELVGANINVQYNFWTGKRGSVVNGRAGYTYSDLDSTDENRSYSRNGVNAGLTIGF